jgi:hypothetical protein
MATVGTGLIILLVLWILAFFFIVLFCSAQSNIKFISIIPVSIAILVTIILGSLPVESSTSTTTIDDTVYSYTSLLWILMLTGMIISLVVGLLVYVISECMEPKYARVSRNVYYIPQ